MDGDRLLDEFINCWRCGSYHQRESAFCLEPIAGPPNLPREGAR
jgi:galactose mutarotase-like enzyme